MKNDKNRKNLDDAINITISTIIVMVGLILFAQFFSAFSPTLGKFFNNVDRGWFIILLPIYAIFFIIVLVITFAIPILITLTGIVCYLYGQTRQTNKKIHQYVKTQKALTPRVRIKVTENRISTTKTVIDKTALSYILYSPVLFLFGSFIIALVLKYSGI